MLPLPRLLRYSTKTRERQRKLHFYLESIDIMGGSLIEKEAHSGSLFLLIHKKTNHPDALSGIGVMVYSVSL